MAEVAFYHLQTISLETALPQLLSKCLERDWRVVVEFGEPDRIAKIDEHLWTFSDAAFLPHAAEGAGQADKQPIWLSPAKDNPNGAHVRFYVEGASPDQDDDISGYQRAIIMFDGNQTERVTHARTLWKQLSGAGHELSYWKQSEEGRWQRAN